MGLQRAFVKDIVNATGATSESIRYGAHRPGSRIVLVGYSHGATIINDALCGGGHKLVDINDTEPTITEYNIKAVLLPGDHRFTPGQPFSAGSTTVAGFDTRPPGQLSCGKYDDKIQLYCDVGDPCCSDGKTRCSLARHNKIYNSYYKWYGKQALEFVLKKLKE